jgi:DUF2997 family protein
MKKIKVLIEKKSGKITISPEGYTGSECTEATKKLEEGLGLIEPERELTTEYYQTNEQQQEIGGA